MNEYAFLAFVLAPAVVVTLGYVAVRFQEWETVRIGEKIRNRAAG